LLASIDLDIIRVFERDYGGIPFIKPEDDLRPVDPLTRERLWHELIITFTQNGILVLILWFFGAIFFYYSEKEAFAEDNGRPLSFANAFHFSIVTMSTVGYGDWAPYTRRGQTVGAFFILSGVTILANFAGIVVGYFMTRKELIESEDFLKNSLLTPAQIEDFDADGNGEVDKFEFLQKSLIACKFVDIDKIDLIMAKFNDLDVDKSGTITMSDFGMYEELIQERKDERLKREQIMFDAATE